MRDKEWDEYIIKLTEEEGDVYRAEYLRRFGFSAYMPYMTTEEQIKRQLEKNKPFKPLPEGCKS